jgi:hypothetical protein
MKKTRGRKSRVRVPLSPRMPCQMRLRWYVRWQARILIGQSHSSLPIGMEFERLELSPQAGSLQRCFSYKNSVAIGKISPSPLEKAAKILRFFVKFMKKYVQ